MEQKEIIEGNKLIAEFVGVKIGVDKYYWRPGSMELLREEHLNYHDSWGWIMPVVEKIARIPLPGATLNWESHFPRTFGMIAENGQIMVRFNSCPVILADTLIEATWLAVVDFIRWYNQSLTPKIDNNATNKS